MDRLSQARTLVSQMTDKELVTLAFHVLNCDWTATSDQVADIFFHAFAALDRDCAGHDFDLIEDQEIARAAEQSVIGMAA